jgi:lysophospholipase L1-like esterase
VYRNKPGQKIIFRAVDYSTGAPKTGDAANIVTRLSIDGAATAALNTATVTEVDATNSPGEYSVTLAQWETRGETLRLSGKSSTANVRIEPVTITTAMEPGKPYSRPDCLFWIEPRLGGLFQDVAKTAPATANTNVVKFAPDWSINSLDGTVSNDSFPYTLDTSTLNGVTSLAPGASSGGGFNLGNSSTINNAANAPMTRYAVIRMPSSLPPYNNTGGWTVMLKGFHTRLCDIMSGGSFGRDQGPITPDGDIAVSTPYIITIVQTPGPDFIERIYINGRLRAVNQCSSLAAPGWDASANLTIGFYAALLSPLTMGAAACFTAAHDDATREAIEGYFSAAFNIPAGRGLYDNKEPTPSARLNVATIGDSLTAGVASSGGGSPAQLATSLYFKPGVRPWSNLGQGGQSASGLATAGTTFARYFDRTACNIMVFWAGTNDLAANASAATAYTSIQTAAASLRAAGWKVIVATTLPRTSLLTGGQTNSGFETARQTVNTNIRASWATFADGLMDVGNASTITVNGVSIDVSAIGAPGASSSATYFIDGTHPGYLGNAIVARVMAEAVTALAKTLAPNMPGENVTQVGGTAQTIGRQRIH